MYTENAGDEMKLKMSDMGIQVSDDESKAIASLKRVAAKWPKSLWLYSASGSLHVMKMRSDGKRAVINGCGTGRGGDGGMDADYIVATIKGIENDGGDW